MKIRFFSLATLFLMPLAFLQAAEPTRPNIVFILADDLGEKNNLAEKMPDKVKELQALMITWRKEVGAKMPTKNTGARE